MHIFLQNTRCTNLGLALSTTVIATSWSLLYVASFTGQRTNKEQRTNTSNLKTGVDIFIYFRLVLLATIIGHDI